MRVVGPSLLVLGSFWALQSASAPAVPADQAKPLQRTFHAGDEGRYGVRLVVHSELEGPGTVKIGSVTYVKTEEHSAESRLAWTATDRVVSVAPDGSAQIREQLDGFGAPVASAPTDGNDAESAKLCAAVLHTLSGWGRGRTLVFRVGASGTSTGLAADAAPELDESPPHLLDLWLIHALRPQATLPDRPVRPGDSWQEPRRVHIAGWFDVGAGETDEWLEGPPGDRAAVRLHVVQEISGRILDTRGKAPPHEAERDEDEPRGAAPASSKTERFFAESLSTIALDDGHLLAASRSARKEIVEVLPPVKGMPQPPRFRATLSVQVEIERCVESPCEAGSNR
jgi:hypothetical protein